MLQSQKQSQFGNGGQEWSQGLSPGEQTKCNKPWDETGVQSGDWDQAQNYKYSLHMNKLNSAYLCIKYWHGYVTQAPIKL